MGSYEDFVNQILGGPARYHQYGAFTGNPLGMYFTNMYAAWANSHGEQKAVLESLPLAGSVINWKESVKKAGDQYQSTGIDPRYGYGTPTNPLLRDLASGVSPVKMARSLSRMYGAEVELDIAKERRASWEASRKAAQSWQQYERMKRNRYDIYGQ